MTTSPSPASPVQALDPAERPPLRIELWDHPGRDGSDGAWWPRSRALLVEAPALVDEFPVAAGRVNRLLFSRPDWDDGTHDGHGVRRVRAARGPVKVGSFPGDDTGHMVASMASGQRLRLLVVPCDTDEAEASRLLSGRG
ncbi:DUF5994 family protein [Nocardioides sp. SYSU DS0663]|uniref:DUF5994 family protein n=1 Tax=Nocardioides sp. SYSU DS0663 TaxID=3416445 RepID=UPI003F4B914E